MNRIASDSQVRIQGMLLRALAAGTIRRGEVNTAVVEHDPWCPMLHGRGTCLCKPVVRIGGRVLLEDGTLAEGAA